MRLTRIARLLAATCASLTFAAEASKERRPCTITSSTSGLEFDLSGLAVLPTGDDKNSKDQRKESWLAKGYDYGVNFTINFCAPVVEEIRNVQGVDEKLWQNVSAYYKSDGKTYSIGQQSSELIFRGRKLVLNYTDGSPCADTVSKRKIIDDDDDDWDSRESRVRKKSSIISLLCEKDTYDSTKPAVSVSFVGASPDECAYFFEARSPLSCGGAAQTKQDVGPGSVFGIIALIAIAVYIFGGIAYQRTIMHQRGWKQIPNYSMWAGIASFCKDMIIILFSSCTRWVPRRRGYSQVPSYSTGRTRGGSREDENRLIDQLDEEWDD